MGNNRQVGVLHIEGGSPANPARGLKAPNGIGFGLFRGILCVDFGMDKLTFRRHVSKLQKPDALKRMDKARNHAHALWLF